MVDGEREVAGGCCHKQLVRSGNLEMVDVVGKWWGHMVVGRNENSHVVPHRPRSWLVTL